MKIGTTMQGSVKSSKSSRFQGVQLWLVQSSVCLFALLIVTASQVVSANFWSSPSENVHEEAVYAQSYSLIPVSKANPNAYAHTNSVTVYPPLSDGVLTSMFGERSDPFDGAKAEFHSGVDIAAPENTPLYAMADGMVLYVREEPEGYGRYVCVEIKEGLRYMYAHCSSIVAETGQSVKAGDVIAYVGNSGRSTGHHVHIEWIVDEKVVDPMTVLPKSTYV